MDDQVLTPEQLLPWMPTVKRLEEILDVASLT